MNLEKARIESIGDIIKSNSKNPRCLNLEITYYQRPYRWPEDRISELFCDYIENRNLALLTKDVEKSKQYFLGAIVLVEKQDNQDSCIYEVVDGQQRLTTIFLMNFLKFVLLRNLIEEKIQTSPFDVKDDIRDLLACYKSFVGKKNGSKLERMKDDIFQMIDSHGSSAWENKDINDILKLFRKKAGLPSKKNLSIIDEYKNSAIEANRKFFEKESFCLHYSYDEYNETLKEALNNIVVAFSKDYDCSWSIIEEPEDEEWPFVSRTIDILDELQHFQESYNPDAITSVDKINVFINLLDELINKLNVCEIITTDADDAYKLFETLNDRSESVSDLELMKDYFYRYYVKTSKDSKSTKNSNLEIFDKIWKEVFSQHEKSIRTLIAYCSIVYITGKTSILQNDSLTKEVREYLNSFCKNRLYDHDDIAGDFEVFKQVELIVKKILDIGDFSRLACMAENEPDASIVKTTLALTIQLDYKAVVAGIICDVLSFYKAQKHGKQSFSDYLDEIFDHVKCCNNHRELWQDVSVIWKSTLLSDDYSKPKEYSDSLIAYRNKNATMPPVMKAVIAIDTVQSDDLTKAFVCWFYDWKYKKNRARQIKAKVLFFHFMLKYTDPQLAKNGADTIISLSSTPKKFRDDVVKQEFDHIEGRTFRLDEKLYYKYDDATRLNEINGLGNMMILDKNNNIKKQTLPMKQGIDYYLNNCEKHWLLIELKELYENNKEINADGNEVPTKAFFETRMRRLVDFFTPVVLGMDASNPPIVIPAPLKP